MTKQEKEEAPGIFTMSLIILVVNLVFGFLAWAAYMFAAKELLFLPHVGLLTGISLWALWIIVSCVPMIYKVLLQYGVNAIATENAIKKSRQEMKDLLMSSSIDPAQTTSSYVNRPRKDRNDLDA